MKRDEIHQCTRDTIDWNKRPFTDAENAQASGDGTIPWGGRCNVCGRKVYELYRQDAELLFDIKTGEAI